MSLSRDELIRLIDHVGPIVRVVVADTKGSTPRETGAAMLVWASGQQGTIGGGTLEFQAAAEAREMLQTSRRSRLKRVALGPDMGQCCGGAVSLFSEVFDQNDVQRIPEHGIFARPTTETPQEPSLSVHRILNQHRNAGQIAATELKDGWMIETIAPPAMPVWIYGAGHVGRALVNVLSPLPQFALTWLDVSLDRFPPASSDERATRLPAENLPAVVKYAPENAHHLVLTYSHETDLALCNEILSRPFAGAGLIGSKTKWARFQRRLGAMGHEKHEIDRISCPIGCPSLGKHPQSIAISVSTSLLEGNNHITKSSGGTKFVG